MGACHYPCRQLGPVFTMRTKRHETRQRLRHALTGRTSPEVKLRVGVALLGRSAVPGDGLDVILRHAPTLGVHRPEVELRTGVSSLLLGSSAVPGDGLGIILRQGPTRGRTESPRVRTVAYVRRHELGGSAVPGG